MSKDGDRDLFAAAEVGVGNRFPRPALVALFITVSDCSSGAILVRRMWSEDLPRGSAKSVPS